MIADLVFFPAAIMRFFWALMGLMAAFVACGLLWILWALLVERVEAARAEKRCLGERDMRL